ncbi:uncharacterized protein LOC134540831 [Bacillus rossius redtenbacheri]|uniref:uncharacterized protein LOC134540831 n=1 Tax=Bacillus rossius redtenbacheri TaxID=93214 RepID=UPI002FDDE3C6
MSDQEEQQQQEPPSAATTPEQVLAAGGVSRRRRGGSSADAKRRSPSGQRKRRVATPVAPPPTTDDDDAEPAVKPARKTAKEKLSSATKKRSQSSPGEARQAITSSSSTSSTTTTTTTEVVRASEDPGGAIREIEESIKQLEDLGGKVAEDAPAEVSASGAEEPPPIISPEVPEVKKTPREPIWGPFLKDCLSEWRRLLADHPEDYKKAILLGNRCAAALLLMVVYLGLGGLTFRFVEGSFETFYKCGVKRVKRGLVDDLWQGNHYMPEEEWRSQARRKLREFEEQLHAAHEAGVRSYSGQRNWSFLNAVVYCLTVVTTIGYGHIAPSTNTGRAITIVYAIFGIPLFLILLADFGKLFTRCIKFVWALVRRVYYTGSCKKVRRTVPVQEVMKGVQLVYDFATFQRRPSQMQAAEEEMQGAVDDERREAHVPLQLPQQLPQQLPPQHTLAQQQPPTPHLSVDGLDPGTPAPSNFEIDDEFNLPISVAIVILVIYIFCGATIYWMWETWGFFEAFYFVFISMSTIGFGDFVPEHPMYMMASIVYLVFGLALTSMCINVVQEKLSDSFRQASAKIGRTIGLQVADEDGNVTPIHVELPAEGLARSESLNLRENKVPSLLAPPPKSMST